VVVDLVTRYNEVSFAFKAPQQPLRIVYQLRLYYSSLFTVFYHLLSKGLIQRFSKQIIYETLHFQLIFSLVRISHITDKVYQG